MPAHRTPDQLLDQFFLDLRARALDMAAGLDRLARSERQFQQPLHDSRLDQLQSALRILTDEADDKARRLQMCFSDPYDPGWRG